MGRDDMSASDAPVERVSTHSFAAAPVGGEHRSMPVTLDGPLAAAHVIHSIPGRVRLRVPMPKTGSHLAHGLEALLAAQTGVTEATVATRDATA